MYITISIFQDKDQKGKGQGGLDFSKCNPIQYAATSHIGLKIKITKYWLN